MIKRIFIDSDSLLYRSAHLTNHKDDCADEALALEVDGDEDIDLGDSLPTDIMEGMKSTFHSMVDEIVKEVQADAKAKGYEVNPTPILVLTVKGSSTKCAMLEDNFRYGVMESVADEAVKGYKANRSGMEVPQGLLEIYDYVFDLENSLCVGGVEADDVCVYYGLQGHIVCALDKDVIYSLPYAYNYGKLQWIETTEDERRLWRYCQAIQGDSSDGLRGIYRVGEKGAIKLLDGKMGTPYEAWRATAIKYAEKDQTIEEAIATMRCVHMGQWSPGTGLVYWQPPTKTTAWEEDDAPCA